MESLHSSKSDLRTATPTSSAVISSSIVASGVNREDQNLALAFRPAISVTALNFDHRDHVDLISEFIAVNAPADLDRLFKKVTITSDLEDWRVVATSVVQTERKTLGIISIEYLPAEPNAGEEVVITFIKPKDWLNSELKGTQEILKVHLLDLADRQNWKKVVLNQDAGSEFLKFILARGELSDGIEIKTFN